MLTNLLLLRAGYQFVQYVSHERIIERRKDEYYLALKKSQHTFGTEHETINPWLNFFLSVVQEQATSALVYLQEEAFEDTLSHGSVRSGIIWYRPGKPALLILQKKQALRYQRCVKHWVSW